MSNQEIKTMVRPTRCCTVCGYPTQARLQVCSVACEAKYRRGRKLIRGSSADDEDGETPQGGFQIITLAES